jgi:hypothetical protein
MATADKWNQLSTPLLSELNPQPLDPYSALICLHSGHHGLNQQSSPIETRRSRQSNHSLQRTANTFQEVVFSLYTLIILDVAATVAILLLNCHQSMEYYGAVLFILSLSHTGYLFGITKDSLIPYQGSMPMAYQQSNRLVVNSLMLILLLYLFPKLVPSLQILYWSLSSLLFVENCSVLNEFFFHDQTITLFGASRCLLNGLKVLLAFAVLIDIFRSHQWLGLWIIIVSILIVISLLIPYLKTWRQFPQQRAAATVTAHSLVIIAIFYLDYSLVLLAGRC